MLVVAMDRLDSSLALLLGGLCLVMLVVSAARASMSRRASLRDLTRAERTRLRDEHAIAASLEVLIAQVQETADAVAARSQAAARRLERLIETADRRIEALRELGADGAQRTCGASAESAASAPFSGLCCEPPGTRSVPRVGAEIGRSHEVQENGYAPANRGGSEDVHSRSIGLAQTAGELAVAGHSTPAIAEALGLTVGEVEVLLGLHAIALRSQREQPQRPKALAEAE